MAGFADIPATPAPVRVRLPRAYTSMTLPCRLFFRVCASVAFLVTNNASLLSQSYLFDHFTAIDGLPSNWITTIHQDSRGYLWVGGDGGMAVYDGVSFTSYGPADGLPVPLVWKLVESRKTPGTVLVGTHTGTLGTFTNGRITSRELSAGGRLTVVSQIVEDRDGVIWCGTNAGVVLVRNDSVSFFSTAPESGNIHLLKELRDGSLLIGTGRTVLRYSPHERKLRRCSFATGSRLFLAVHEDHAGVLWFGTYEGDVVRVEGDSVTATRKTPFRELRSITGDRDGNLWVASPGGVIMIPTRNFPRGLHTRYSMENGLREDDINVCFVDREDNLWIGGRAKGISRLTSRTLVRIRIDGLMPDIFNSSVTVDHEGRLFAATATHVREIWMGTDGNWRTFSHPLTPFVSGPPRQGILPGSMSIAFAPDGLLWVGFTWGGLRSFRITRAPGQRSILSPLHKLRPGDRLPDAGALGITIDPDNQLWYNTRGGPLLQFDLASLSVLATYDVGGEIKGGSAQTVQRMEDGTMWVARFNGGIGIFERQGTRYTLVRNLTTAEGLPSDRIRSLVQRRNGDIWIGTRFDGIAVYRNGRFRSITAKNGLLNDAVWKLEEDSEGRLWVGTSVGLQYTDPDSNSFHVQQRLYGQQVGGLGFVPGRETLWMATNNELFIYEYGREQRSRVAPLIAMAGFRVNGIDRELQDGIVLSHDESFCVLRFNGLSFGNEQGLHYRSRLLGLDTAWGEASNQRIVTYASLNQGSYTFEVHVMTPDGRMSERPATLSFAILPPWYLSPWTIGAYVVFGSFFVFLFVNIRTRRLQERSAQLERMVGERTAEVVEQRNRLKVQSDRLQEMDRLKSHFFTNISHEFRTPLTIIIGHLDRLIHSSAGHDTGDYGVMNRNARRLLQLINQLLDLSRIEAGAMVLRAERTDIVMFTGRIASSLLSYAGHKGIRLTFNHAPVSDTTGQAAILVYMDHDKIEKVMTNLLSNSLKFTPKGGAIDVSISTGGLDHGTQYVEITVKDTGMGIPAENLPYVFDRFYQVEDYAKPGYEGTGVGLALVKELVELHHGTVDVSSVEGNETTFRVRLPLGTAHLDEGEVVEESERTEPGGIDFLPEPDTVPAESAIRVTNPDETRILIVEDHADLRDFIRQQLADEYAVMEADNGTDGFLRAEEHLPDLVISDIMMPGMDGFALCTALKTSDKTNHIPVILLTAKATTANKIEGLEAGADDYLTKPFVPDELRARVRNLLQNRRQLREKFSGEMLVQPAAVTVPSVHKVFLERVTAAIETHLAEEDFSVEALAVEVGLSRAQLHRKLKALTNKGPNELIRSFRLQRAAGLLMQDAGSIAEIAYQVGFGSQAYFTRSFSEEFGCTPSEFRKRKP